MSKIVRKQGIIYGVGINGTHVPRVLSFMRENIRKNKKGSPVLIVTPNPEQVLLASKDVLYRKILNYSDIAIPDGIGLVQAIRFLDLPTPKNIFLKAPYVFFQGVWVGLATFFNKKWLFKNFSPVKGRELFLDIMKLANKKGWKVFLFGGEQGEAQETANKLGLSLKKIKMKAMDGPKLTKKGTPFSKKEARFEKRAIATINAFSPDLLFLGFTPPKQEKWFWRNKRKLKVGAVMVLGGTFKYIAGKSKLPPSSMSSLGLEWLWRLITEPYRLGRILTAFPIFPFKVFLYKLKRQNTP